MLFAFVASHINKKYRLFTLLHAVKSVLENTVLCDRIVISISLDKGIDSVVLDILKKEPKITLLYIDKPTYQFDHYLNIYKNISIDNDDTIIFLDDDDLYDKNLIRKVKENNGEVLRFMMTSFCDAPKKEDRKETRNGDCFTLDTEDDDNWHITEYFQYAIKGHIFKEFFKKDNHICKNKLHKPIGCRDCYYRDLDFGSFVYNYTKDIQYIDEFLYYKRMTT